MKTSKSKFKEHERDRLFNVLLVPISIVLAGVLIAVSVLYSASVILDQDQLVTKSALSSVLKEELSKLNIGQNSGHIDTPPPAPTPIVVNNEQLNDLRQNHPIVVGDRNSPLTFVEFGDPSCPFCSLASGNPDFLQGYPNYTPPLPEIKKIVQEGKASYIWVYLPTHGNGEVAAQALYCANERGKFWEVHDKIMVSDGYKKVENEVKNDVSKVSVLSEYIKEIVDPKFIDECVKSGKYKDRLNQDINIAGKWGVNATPTFFVNVEQVLGSNYSDFIPLIDKYKSQ